MKKRIVVLALVVAGLILGGLSWGQQAAQPVPYPQAIQSTPQLPANFIPSAGATTYTLILNAAAQSEIAHLVKQIGEAEHSAKKADLTKSLEAAVAKSF